MRYASSRGRRIHQSRASMSLALLGIPGMAPTDDSLTLVGLGAQHQYYRLHMLRPRKLIEPLPLNNAVSASLEQGEVAHLGGRVAGDVDDARGGGVDDVGDGGGVDALARGVEHDDVGALTGGGEAG